MEYMVSVRCFTYNHSKYITDALNGFVSQQTTFPFVIVVVDDASTDGEQDVIRSFVNEHFDVDNVNAENRETEYAHITCASHKSNKNCDIVVLYLKYNHYQLKKKKLPYLSEWLDNSKYHALCEGDDYWIDPLKLQKQVDFLEANPEYSLSFHAAKLFQSGKFDINNNFARIEDREYSGIEIFEKWQVPTASVVYRRDLLDSPIYEKVKQSNKFIYGDTPLFCAASCVGKLRGMSDVMSVYRKHAGGATAISFNLPQRLKLYSHHLEFGRVFGKTFENPSLYVMSRDCVADIFTCFRKRKIRDAICIVRFTFSKSICYTIVSLLVYPCRYIMTKMR